MKILLILLAFYVTLISCFPCQDVPARIAIKGSTATDITHDETHHQNKPGDFCSPFCICTCCASVSLPPMMFGFALPFALPDTPEKSFEYNASFNTPDSGLIWQPPRLG